MAAWGRSPGSQGMALRHSGQAVSPVGQRHALPSLTGKCRERGSQGMALRHTGWQ
jgi:hypothetical protein